MAPFRKILLERVPDGECLRRMEKISEKEKKKGKDK
tara:strand:- start:702 stop:809 length:108 start_codon:yes stop_codon:yes gene_type:complete